MVRIKSNISRQGTLQPVSILRYFRGEIIGIIFLALSISIIYVWKNKINGQLPLFLSILLIVVVKSHPLLKFQSKPVSILIIDEKLFAISVVY